MTDEHDNASGKRERAGPLAIAVAVLVALPAVYLFATGPITWLGNRGYIDERFRPIIFAVYAPLVYLITHSEWCDKKL